MTHAAFWAALGVYFALGFAVALNRADLVGGLDVAGSLLLAAAALVIWLAERLTGLAVKNPPAPLVDYLGIRA